MDHPCCTSGGAVAKLQLKTAQGLSEITEYCELYKECDDGSPQATMAHKRAAKKLSTCHLNGDVSVQSCLLAAIVCDCHVCTLNGNFHLNKKSSNKIRTEKLKNMKEKRKKIEKSRKGEEEEKRTYRVLLRVVGQGQVRGRSTELLQFVADTVVRLSNVRQVNLRAVQFVLLFRALQIFAEDLHLHITVRRIVNSELDGGLITNVHTSGYLLHQNNSAAAENNTTDHLHHHYHTQPTNTHCKRT